MRLLLTGKRESLPALLTGKGESPHTPLTGKGESPHALLDRKGESLPALLTGKVESTPAPLTGKRESTPALLTSPAPLAGKGESTPALFLEPLHQAIHPRLTPPSTHAAAGGVTSICKQQARQLDPQAKPPRGLSEETREAAAGRQRGPRGRLRARNRRRDTSWRS